MNTAKFWSMIEAAHQQSGNDPAKQHEFLVESLYDLSPEDIQEFDRLLWMMMAQADRTDIGEAVWLIECGCDDDEFHDFRNWLIAQGQTVYNKVLEDPENLSGIVGKEHRYNGFPVSIVYTASEAYERKAGQKIPRTGYYEKPSLISGDLSADNDLVKNPPRIGEGLNPESEISKKFPRIVAKLGKCEDEPLFY